MTSWKKSLPAAEGRISSEHFWIATQALNDALLYGPESEVPGELTLSMVRIAGAETRAWRHSIADEGPRIGNYQSLRTDSQLTLAMRHLTRAELETQQGRSPALALRQTEAHLRTLAKRMG